MKASNAPLFVAFVIVGVIFIPGTEAQFHEHRPYPKTSTVYKRWHSMHLSDNCWHIVDIYESQEWGVKELDCENIKKVESTVEVYDEGCTKEDYQKVVDVFCRTDVYPKDSTVFKKWHAMAVSKQCSTVVKRFEEYMMGDYTEDCTGVKDEDTQKEALDGGCTVDEYKAMVDAVCNDGGIKVILSWLLMSICLLFHMFNK